LINAALLDRGFSPQTGISPPCIQYDPNEHIFYCLSSSFIEYLLLNDAVVGIPGSMSAKGNILMHWMFYQQMKKGAAAPILPGNESKKTGARSARVRSTAKTHS